MFLTSGKYGEIVRLRRQAVLVLLAETQVVSAEISIALGRSVLPSLPRPSQERQMLSRNIPLALLLGLRIRLVPRPAKRPINLVVCRHGLEDPEARGVGPSWR
jgi:hypothetical protein